MEATNLDVSRGLSLGPGVLSLDEDPFGHELITIRAENIGVTTHLAAPFTGDGGNGLHRCNAITLEGLQFEVFPTANDVAAVDVASSAVLLEQHCSRAGVLNGSGCCFRTPQVEQQQQKRTKAPAQDMDQHRDGVALISLLEPGMPPFGTAESVHQESGNPEEEKCAIGSGNPSKWFGEWR